jgi:hypothetical protein
MVALPEKKHKPQIQNGNNATENSTYVVILGAEIPD